MEGTQKRQPLPESASLIVRHCGSKSECPVKAQFIEEPTGRGIVLMRTFADEVRFNEKGNEVTLMVRQAD